LKTVEELLKTSYFREVLGDVIDEFKERLVKHWRDCDNLKKELKKLGGL
jgi:hypothetical protein